MTKIEWTDDTWNPFVGCSIISKGCTNCYAMRMAHRLGAISAGKLEDFVDFVLAGRKNAPI